MVLTVYVYYSFTYPGRMVEYLLYSACSRAFKGIEIRSGVLYMRWKKKKNEKLNTLTLSMLVIFHVLGISVS